MSHSANPPLSFRLCRIEAVPQRSPPGSFRAPPSIRVWLCSTSLARVLILSLLLHKPVGKTMKKIALALSAMTLLGLAACAEFVGKGKAPAPAPAAPIIRKG